MTIKTKFLDKQSFAQATAYLPCGNIKQIIFYGGRAGSCKHNPNIKTADLSNEQNKRGHSVEQRTAAAEQCEQAPNMSMIISAYRRQTTYRDRCASSRTVLRALGGFHAGALSVRIQYRKLPAECDQNTACCLFYQLFNNTRCTMT